MSELMLCILGIALVAGIGAAGVIYGDTSANLGLDKAVKVQAIHDSELYKGALINCQVENICELNRDYSVEFLVANGFIDEKFLSREVVVAKSSNVVGEYN